MFGYLGRPIGKLITESVGEGLASKRPFIVAHSVKEDRFSRYTRGFFDIENVGTQPQEQAKVNNTFVANDNTPLFTLPIFNPTIAVPSSGYVFSNFYDIPGTSYHRGWQFSTSTALSPPSRKHQFEFHFPETISAVAFSDNSSAGSQSSTSNSVQGTLDINLCQFPNSEAFIINQGFVQTLNFIPNNRLKIFYLIDANDLSTINGTLPSTVLSVQINNTNLTSISELISGATGIRYFQLGKTASFPSSIGGENALLSGIVDLSHLINLTEFLISGTHNLVTNYVLPRKTDWLLFHVTNMATTPSTNFSTDYIDDVFMSPDLKLFIFSANNKIITRNINNNDLSSELQYLYIHNNQWSGDFVKTDTQTALKELRLGINQNEGNRFSLINLSGFSGSVISTIQIQGVECENLQLPATLPSLTSFYAYDNKLSLSTNPDLVTKLNVFTALTDLRFGNGSSSTSGSFGQVSVDGLGANADISGLINLTTCYLNSCELSGTLTLPNVNRLASLVVTDNPSLTSFVNLTSHTSLQILYATDCTNLNFSITNNFTLINTILAAGTKVQSIVLSGKTAGTMNELHVNDCPELTEIKFKADSARMVFGSPRTIRAYNNPLLTSVVNMEYVSWNANTFAINAWLFNNCALDVTFPFGQNNFTPNEIQVQDNSMSTANVDATITSIYNNKSKWSTYSITKSLNIAGTNAAPTGTYQAPAGFVLGSNDGTPASVKEQAYVLVNNYGWTITFN